MTNKLLDICADIAAHLPLVLDDIESAGRRATVLTRTFAHKVVRNIGSMIRLASHSSSRVKSSALAGLRLIGSKFD
jgi:hypothetical protein